MAKIVIYHPILNQVRGAELIIKYVAEHLAIQNEVYVISHDEAAVEIPKVKHISIKNHGEFNLVNNLKFSSKIREKMSKISYDILLTSNAPPVIDTLISRKDKGGAIHLCWCHEPRRSIFYKEFGSGTISCIKYRGLRPKIRIPVYKRLYVYAFKNNYDGIIVYSYYIRDILMKIGVSKDKISIVPWGVDTKNITPKPLKETKIVLYVGSTTLIKNVYRLIEAMKIVSSRFKDSKLVMVGPSADGDRFTRALNEVHGIVEYLGVKTGRELDELYEKSQIVAYPTIDEPWGLVPLEAMAHGRPVVVGTGGPRESVIDGTTGIHVDPLSIEDIAKGILNLLGDFDRCKYMGIKGREHVVNNYDISYSLKIIDKLFCK